MSGLEILEILGWIAIGIISFFYHWMFIRQVID